MKKPKLINPIDNEDNVEAGRTWRQSADFGRLIELMFQVGAFGVTKKGDIWQTIYTELKYEPDVPSSKSKQADKENTRQN